MQETSFLEQVNACSEQTIQLCYHCHKCTSGCPVASEMTYGPDQVLRMVQTGARQPLLGSRDIWLCASCEICGTRCPNKIDIARVMDALRQIAVSSGCTTADPNAVKFHQLFLSVIKSLGRTHEATLLGLYKFRSRDLLSDLGSGARLLAKGKIPLLPHRIRGRREVKHIFETASKADFNGWTERSGEFFEDE